jgi:hypothetical protein
MYFYPILDDQILFHIALLFLAIIEKPPILMPISYGADNMNPDGSPKYLNQWMSFR